MITDEEIKLKGMAALVTALGSVEAERFVTLILRASFDYTKWQEKLWLDRGIEDISRAAMELRAEETS